MQACRNQNEILMLDVLGELNDPQMRRNWEDHLQACDGCRRERARTLGLLGRVKQAGMPPELPPRQADAMAKAVGWRLRNERLAPRGETRRRFRIVPVLATACAIMVAVLGGYRLQQYLSDSGNEIGISADLMLPEDLEIIKHLDLLKDMDTLEKLMHVVDVPDNGTPGAEQGPSETQGMQRNENEERYA
jgi:hypothetical protein